MVLAVWLQDSVMTISRTQWLAWDGNPANEPKDGGWDGWSDEQLRDYESRLFDEEQAGDDNWDLREAALDEMRRRGMF